MHQECRWQVVLAQQFHTQMNVLVLLGHRLGSEALVVQYIQNKLR